MMIGINGIIIIAHWLIHVDCRIITANSLLMKQHFPQEKQMLHLMFQHLWYPKIVLSLLLIPQFKQIGLIVATKIHLFQAHLINKQRPQQLQLLHQVRYFQYTLQLTSLVLMKDIIAFHYNILLQVELYLDIITTQYQSLIAAICTNLWKMLRFHLLKDHQV